MEMHICLKGKLELISNGKSNVLNVILCCVYILAQAAASRRAHTNVGKEAIFLEKTKETLELINLVKKDKLKLGWVKNKVLENLGKVKTSRFICTCTPIMYFPLSNVFRTKREGGVVPILSPKQEDKTEKLGAISDMVTDANTSARGLVGNQSFVLKSSMPNLMQRIEAQHDAMVTKAKRVLDELSK